MDIAMDGGIGRERSSPTAAAPGGTQAIQRAARILRELGANNRRGLRLLELTDRLALQRPTVHRILRCLVAERLVRYDMRIRRYYLGEGVFELGLSATPRLHLREHCQPGLAGIAASTGDTVFLIVRRGDDSVVIDRKEGAFPIRAMPVDIGSRRPLGVGAGGLAILGEEDEEMIRRIVHENGARYRPYSMSPASVARALAKTRQQGYAYSKGYGSPGITGIALPLKDKRNTVLGAISVTAISPRMTGAHRRLVVTALQRELAVMKRVLDAALLRS